jgi:hypothetical protein
MLKISIPKPCHEDWNAMTPNEQGRHCNACAKTVVDFTTMSDDAVKHFFINKKEERVCGRFRNQQLQRISIELPQNIFHIAMPVWKKFLVASLIVFSGTLFSCDTTIKGNAKNSNEVITGALISPVQAYQPKADTTTLPVPLISPVIKGYTQEVLITGVTQGDIMIAPEPLVAEVEVIPQAGTDTLINPTVKNIQDKMGIIALDEQDTLKIKNPLTVDSVKCETQIYIKR